MIKDSTNLDPSAYRMKKIMAISNHHVIYCLYITPFLSPPLSAAQNSFQDFLVSGVVPIVVDGEWKLVKGCLPLFFLILIVITGSARI